MKKNKLVLIGAGGHARSCIDVIEQEGKYEICGLVGLSQEVGSCNIVPDPLFGKVGGGEGALDYSGASFFADTAGGSGFTVKSLGADDTSECDESKSSH